MATFPATYPEAAWPLPTPIQPYETLCDQSRKDSFRQDRGRVWPASGLGDTGWLSLPPRTRLTSIVQRCQLTMLPTCWCGSPSRLPAEAN